MQFYLRCFIFLLFFFAVFSVFGSIRVWAQTEHPEPSVVREKWLDLSGPWNFGFDDTDEGLRQKWYIPGNGNLKLIIDSRFPHEAPASGIRSGDSFHPVTWYEKHFTLPREFNGGSVLLNFGAVDYEARVWVNGTFVGQHIGGTASFRFDITDYLKPGSNTISLRAFDPPQDPYIARGKQSVRPEPYEIFSGRTSGPYRPIWMEATGVNYFAKPVRPTFNADTGRVLFEAKFVKSAPGHLFRVIVSQKDLKTGMLTEVAREEGAVVGEKAAFAVKIPAPQLWSQKRPYLYHVSYELLTKNHEVIDRVTSQIGLRTISNENGRFQINGEDFYLKGILDQIYLEDTHLAALSEKQIKNQIRAILKAGYNYVRVHQTRADPRFLYWADVMGLLVSAEMPSRYLFDERRYEEQAQELQEMVDLDYAHPSIIRWVPTNETWGFPLINRNGNEFKTEYARDPVKAEEMRDRQIHARARLVTLIRAKDGTRLVSEDDGWQQRGDKGDEDSIESHFYPKTGQEIVDRYGFLKRYTAPHQDLPSPAYGNDMPQFIDGGKTNGTPLNLGEVGGIGYLPPGPIPPGTWGYEGIERDLKGFIFRFHDIMTGVAQCPAFAGFCYTQKDVVGKEVNGLFDAKGRPLLPLWIVREINSIPNAKDPASRAVVVFSKLNYWLNVTREKIALMEEKKLSCSTVVNH